MFEQWGLTFERYNSENNLPHWIGQFCYCWCCCCYRWWFGDLHVSSFSVIKTTMRIFRIENCSLLHPANRRWKWCDSGRLCTRNSMAKILLSRCIARLSVWRWEKFYQTCVHFAQICSNLPQTQAHTHACVPFFSLPFSTFPFSLSLFLLLLLKRQIYLFYFFIVV